jgi:methylase of polypeptide subunit release factors|tara:strand:- start:3752 stop:4429 length:678 start_codon:yes stop_codon:yes gene_type:complete
MVRWLTYCADSTLLDCRFPVYYKLENYGGGPDFIEGIYSSKSFLEEHKDCKSVLEVCCGPGFVGWYLYNKFNLDTIHFLDIHKPVLEDIKKTASYNNADYNFYLSDGFENYDGPKVDLIIANSPFMPTEKEYSGFIFNNNITDKDRIENDKRLYLDKDLKLHKNLLENFNSHLTDNGRIVFLQDKKSTTRDTLEQFNFNYSSSNYQEFEVKSRPHYDSYIVTYFK